MEPMIAEVVDPAPKECIGVAKDDPKHKDWWMGRFNQKNAELKKGDTKILMIGDSITHGWEGSGKQVWEKYYGAKKAINLGIGGDQTQHVIWRIEHYDFSKINAKLAVLLIGVNNAGAGSTAANIAMGNRKICKILHEKFPQMKILLLNVFPWEFEAGKIRKCRRTKVGNPIERWFPLGLFLILPFQFVQNGITFFMYKTDLIIVCITVGWFYITIVVMGSLDLYETESSHEVDSISENTKSKEE